MLTHTYCSFQKSCQPDSYKCFHFEQLLPFQNMRVNKNYIWTVRKEHVSRRPFLRSGRVGGEVCYGKAWYDLPRLSNSITNAHWSLQQELVLTPSRTHRAIKPPSGSLLKLLRPSHSLWGGWLSQPAAIPTNHHCVHSVSLKGTVNPKM